MSLDSFKTRTTLTSGSETVTYYSLTALEAEFPSVATLPFSLKILLENLLRREDNGFVKADDIRALASWNTTGTLQKEISFMPARVLLQDFTGVPCVVDLAAMRDGMISLGGNPDQVNPLQPVELVIDHSVQVDHFGTSSALQLNAELEYQRNRERYVFLRWGQDAFRNFRVVPPETGIVHQVNIEYLARVVYREQSSAGQTVVYPDTLFGTDSHTTMVNGLGVVGWGVGGIEAEAAMLGQPSSMLIPAVLGCRLTGAMPAGTTATDLVLTITETLRKKGVVGKFVEFFGNGLRHLTIADRVTLGNMCPEYGATVAIFPIDQMTLEYLRLTGREASHIKLVEDYARAQGLFRTDNSPDAAYSETIEFNLSTVVPSLAGPRRPQDRVALNKAKASFASALPELKKGIKAVAASGGTAVATTTQLEHGSVVIAAITSCTNTSNPSVMIGAGLLAKNAVAKGLKSKPWVKTSLAPGSKVVTDYLTRAALLDDLEALGFNVVGYGCTTCIGNSGPLPEHVSHDVRDHGLVVASVLSGNRNFEGRIQQDVRANYLASPPLVVAYALAGSMNVDLTTQPLGKGTDGADVYLKDIWPSEQEIQQAMMHAVTADAFRVQYAKVFEGPERWRALPVPTGDRFAWDDSSTYIRRPPFLENLTMEPSPRMDITGARALAVLGDSITTDHISPAGSIKADSPAGRYLIEHGVEPKDFNSYGARRGNHEVMMRGTFANVRLKNQLAPGTEGGVTSYLGIPGSLNDATPPVLSIYEASMLYQKAGVPLIVLAGKEYGSGSSRDWAAKGTMLLGVKAVIAESFERIHRSNLVNMGVLPLEFKAGEHVTKHKLTGRETFELVGSGPTLTPRGDVLVRATAENGTVTMFTVTVRIDTPEELTAFSHGGILPYVLRQLVRKN
ncbi:MAG TPA: aconitate hydratase AcnA [Vicinamibacterales bacterium]|nr:aconitate hydratase AcnA [Vicinamibacterales bacterium]